MLHKLIYLVNIQVRAKILAQIILSTFYYNLPNLVNVKQYAGEGQKLLTAFHF